MIIISLIIFGIIALIVAAILGIISSMIAWRIVRKRDLKSKRLIVIFAAITPALVIGMEMVLGLIGSVYISETKGVDWGFGDYWEAPLTESNFLGAVDFPENATIGSREDDCHYESLVRHLWVSEDSIVAACSSLDDYSLYVFHFQDSGVDTLLHRADSLQFKETLKSRSLNIKTALTPDEYFIRAQREAHKIESPLRHTIVILTLLALWAILIRHIKKKSS